MADVTHVDVEVWVVADEDGNEATGPDRESCWTAYTDNIGWDDENPLSLRWVKIVVKVPIPKPISLSATVPAESEEAELTVQ